MCFFSHGISKKCTTIEIFCIVSCKKKYLLIYKTLEFTGLLLIMNYKLRCRIMEGPRGLEALAFFSPFQTRPFLPLQPLLFVRVALLSNRFLENGQRKRP